MIYTDHGQAYSDHDVLEILNSVKTIAMVGASADEAKPSYHVLRFLIEAGYEMIPVNPRPDLTEILGQKVYPSLQSIDRPVDMVDVFRPSAELAGIASVAVDIGASVLWAQLGIHDDEAARIAEASGLRVLMDRCPKIELAHAGRETNPTPENSHIESVGPGFADAANGATWADGPSDTTLKAVGATPSLTWDTTGYE